MLNSGAQLSRGTCFARPAMDRAFGRTSRPGHTEICRFRVDLVHSSLRDSQSLRVNSYTYEYSSASAPHSAQLRWRRSGRDHRGDIGCGRVQRWRRTAPRATG